jgi:hypothetical protein
MTQKPKVNEILMGMALLAMGAVALVFTADLTLVPPAVGLCFRRCRGQQRQTGAYQRYGAVLYGYV